MRHLRDMAISLFSFSLVAALFLLCCISPLGAVAAQNLHHYPYVETLSRIHPSLQVMQTDLIAMSGPQQLCVQFEATDLEPNDKDRKKKFRSLNTCLQYKC